MWKREKYLRESLGLNFKSWIQRHVIVCVSKSRAANSRYQAAPDEEVGGRGRCVNAVSVFPPTPKKNKNNAHYSGQSRACHNIAMAPQQAKKQYIYFLSIKSVVQNKKKEKIILMSLSFFHISRSALHMHLWVSALSHTFFKQFRMQVNNGRKKSSNWNERK